MAERLVPVISLKDYETRKDEITQQLLKAAEGAGFFTLVDHGIAVEEIEKQFSISRAFFDLPIEVKGKTPHDTKTNNGWEYKAQLRPSTGTYDQKESLWLQHGSQWPSDQDVPAFMDTTKDFMAKCAVISNQVLSCFAIALGFPEDYFLVANDVTKPDCLTQLRFIHYPASESAPGTWRAGSHTDIGCLTLLFQREGEDGLEICPGRESHTSFASGDTFTPLPAHTGPIVVNIGDMLSMNLEQDTTFSSNLLQWLGQMTVSNPTSTVSAPRKSATHLRAIPLPISIKVDVMSFSRDQRRSSTCSESDMRELSANLSTALP